MEFKYITVPIVYTKENWFTNVYNTGDKGVTTLSVFVPLMYKTIFNCYKYT